MMRAGDPVALETRVAGALNNILGIYNIPRELRDEKIRRVFEMDYRKLGLRILSDFKAYVNEANDQAFQELLKQ
jgi:hypothetical protein